MVYVNAVILAILFTIGLTQMRWVLRSYEYYPWMRPGIYFFLGLFTAIFGEIFAVISIHRKIRLSISTSSHSPTPIGRMDTPPRTTPQSYGNLNPNAYHGRMDTPPRTTPQSYGNLNPNAYHGRMDTPPKGVPQSYTYLNPKAFHGRMDTPSALKMPAFCPKCGQAFSPFVQEILRQKKTCFCENCGFSLSSL
ncbi:MAG: hypothetical protein ACTSWW_05785 [Promethearchaeota archaeon]